MKGIKDILKVIRDTANDTRKNGDPVIINELDSLGKSLIELAYETKDTNDKFYNQHDAYGYVVFYNGAEKRRGFLGAEKSTNDVEEVPGMRGRREIEKAIVRFVPNPKGYTLVVMNAMYYSKEQEEGIEYGGVVKTWQILSQVFDNVEEASSFFEDNGFKTWYDFNV